MPYDREIEVRKPAPNYRDPNDEAKRPTEDVGETTEKVRHLVRRKQSRNKTLSVKNYSPRPFYGCPLI